MLSLCFSLASNTDAATAESEPLGNLSGYVQVGYLQMGAISTPLLHYARTGQMYDDRILLERGNASLPEEQRNLYRQYRQATDEFAARELLAKLDEYLTGTVKALRERGGYFLEANGKLMEYDFRRNGFPVRVEFASKLPGTDEGAFCAGVHGVAPPPKKGYLTVCVGASNLVLESAFKFLPMQDQTRARMLRTNSNANELAFYVVANVDGKYQLLNDARYQFGNGMQTYYVTGLQPTKAIAVLVVDRRNGDILAKLSPSQAESAADAGRPSDQSASALDVATSGPNGRGPSGGIGPVGSAPELDPAGTSGTNTTPLVSAAGTESAAGSRDPSTVIFGVPNDPATLRTDKLLALLSWGTYSDSDKVSKANKALQRSIQKFERIQSDDARLTALQKKELRNLDADIRTQTTGAQTLQRMEELKRDVPPTFEASRIAVRDIKTVHYEHYRLRDGRHIVAFRGTDANWNDNITDVKLAVNPETLAELARRVKTRSIAGAVVGLGEHLSEDAGQPLAFKAADRIVADIIRSGVPASMIILTGHSLGGGYAQYAGFKNHVLAVVTFNTAPLSTQLIADAGIMSGPGATTVRHYIAMISKSDGTRTVDPVSQKAQFLGLPDLQALQVVGKQYVVQVCSGLGSAEYKSFAIAVQRGIATGTTSAIAMGHNRAKLGASAAGAAAGFEEASVEKGSSTMAGARVGSTAATGYSALANCKRHPFLCGGAAVGGGVVSAVAYEKVPIYWEVYNAHGMKGLYESVTASGSPSCLADGVLGTPLPEEKPGTR